jgi:hypothetical protein
MAATDQKMSRMHVRVFPTGGHLGNLYQPEVQAELMSSLDDLKAEARTGKDLTATDAQRQPCVRAQTLGTWVESSSSWTPNFAPRRTVA